MEAIHKIRTLEMMNFRGGVSTGGIFGIGPMGFLQLGGIFGIFGIRLEFFEMKFLKLRWNWILF